MAGKTGKRGEWSGFHRGFSDSPAASDLASDEEIEEIEEELSYEDEVTWGTLLLNLYYGLMNLALTLGAMVCLLIAYWLYKWGHCRDCCCNSCNRGSSYCAFPRFPGEDIGDPVRNFAFFLGIVGLVNFCISYSIWANMGSPRMYLLAPSMIAPALALRHALNMKWLLCHPVKDPVDNLANWITMEAMATEHGRVSVYTLCGYMALIFLDFCVGFMCCCCYEQVEVEEEAAAGSKAEKAKTE